MSSRIVSFTEKRSFSCTAIQNKLMLTGIPFVEEAHGAKLTAFKYSKSIS